MNDERGAYRRTEPVSFGGHLTREQSGEEHQSLVDREGDRRVEGFHRVARADEIPPGKAKVVTVNDRPIAVFNVEGKFYAIYNVCPHEGGPLGKGHVKGFVVSCPWHDLAFDVRNGQGTDQGGYCVGSYEVLVQGEDLFIGPRRKI